MLTAQRVAKYMVKYSNSINKPLSNLKLQKLLYFAWIENYKRNKEYLFDEDFYAWQFGPVVPVVYYEYCAYGGLPIIQYSQNNNDDVLEDEDIIKSVVERYKDISALQMVKMTHESGHAWDHVYRNGAGYRCRISFTEIIRYEC